MVLKDLRRFQQILLFRRRGPHPGRELLRPAPRLSRNQWGLWEERIRNDGVADLRKGQNDTASESECITLESEGEKQFWVLKVQLQSWPRPDWAPGQGPRGSRAVGAVEPAGGRGERGGRVHSEFYCCSQQQQQQQFLKKKDSRIL